MPEIKFYITDEERMELFDFVTGNQGIFTPDLIYDKPQSTQIKNKEELIKCIYEQVVGFYIISSSFQIEPIVLKEFDMDGLKYHIQQRIGGPYIDISFYRGFADDAPIKYKSTIMFHYARYLHYDWEANFGEFPVTEDLKAYYKMIVKFLKSKCRQITAKNGKKYWVSKTLSEKEIL